MTGKDFMARLAMQTGRRLADFYHFSGAV